MPIPKNLKSRISKAIESLENQKPTKILYIIKDTAPAPSQEGALIFILQSEDS